MFGRDPPRSRCIFVSFLHRFHTLQEFKPGSNGYLYHRGSVQGASRMVQLMHGHGVHRSGVADPDSLSHCNCTILGCVTPISLLPKIAGFSRSVIGGSGACV
jgi:hypothetical protein